MIVTTDFSLFKSAIQMSDIFTEFKDSEFVIIADNNLNAVPNFVFGCRKNNIKPIISTLKESAFGEYLFIAKNVIGYKELIKFETLGYTQKVFSSEHIIVVLNNIYNEEKAHIPEFAFKRNSKFENSNDDKYNKIIEANENIKVLSPKILNCLSEEDHSVVAAMQAVGKKSFLEREMFKTYSNWDYGFNDEEFLSMVDRIEDFIHFGDPLPPEFKFKKEVAIEEGLDPDTIDDNILFRHLVHKGLKKRFKGKEVPQNYIDRVEFEMNVIEQMKFPGYFLIVWDFINFAKRELIPVGPGRGSAAGACIAWSLEITNIDPIPHGLLFERFLNPDRVSFPDIDIDFCQSRRQEVIDYTIDKYGVECVAQVITFGTMGAKGSVKDSGRIQQVAGVVSDKISKEIPEEPGITFGEIFSSDPEKWKDWREKDYFVDKTLSLAVRFAGFNRNHGTHAAAVVISNLPIYEKAPVYSVSGTQAIGFEGSYLEEADLVKYDFLGLKTLTILDFTVKNVKQSRNEIIDLDNLGIEDSKVYEYISTGDTRGMFQIESAGMQSLAEKLQPSNFDEVTAMLALYRPGPMEAGMLDSFIERKHGREEIDYFFESMTEDLKPILEPTYGLIVYQEQVMQIVRTIAGFSLGESDLVRRAMGKKDPEKMAKISKDFVKGAEKQGHNPKEALELFQLIEKFAGYGFNKSHSAAYALITYYTAFLKLYFPAEFMAALIQLEINSTSKNLDKVAFYVEEARRMKIPIVGPNLDTSELEFTIKDGSIVYGLKGVKTVGKESYDLVMAYKDHYKGDLLNFFWNLQSDHNASMVKMEKKKITLDKRVETCNAAILKKTDTYNKRIQSKKNKIVTLQNGIKKTKSKYEDTGLIKEEKPTYSEKDLASITKKEEEIKEIEEFIKTTELVIPDIQKKKDTLLELENLEREYLFLKQNSIDLPKVKKSNFEGLASVGGLDCFGVSRKFLLENQDELLDPSKVLSIDLKDSKIEYTLAEKLPIEMSYLHTTITSPFGDKLEEYVNLEMPENMHITTLLSKTTKVKRDGKNYISAILKCVNNRNYEIGDFNNRLAKYEVGDVFVSTIKNNGKYTNLQKIAKIGTVIKNLAPIRKVLKIDILEEIPDISEYKEINVFDNNKFVMTISK